MLQFLKTDLCKHTNHSQDPKDQENDRSGDARCCDRNIIIFGYNMDIPSLENHIKMYKIRLPAGWAGPAGPADQFLSEILSCLMLSSYYYTT